MVTGLVLMFAFTTGGVVWLARDVDRGIANRSLAQSVAFQAARAGAQQVDVVALRSGEHGAPVHADRARAAVHATATAAFAAAEVRGRVTMVHVERDRVTVHVDVHDPTRTVTGAATVRSADRP